MTASMTTDHTIAVPPAACEDLRRRLAATRLPDVPDGVDERGVPLEVVARLLTAWREDVDWAVVEERINLFPLVLRRSEHGSTFAVHLRGSGEGVPVVLLHGWADTFYSQLPVAERVADAGHDVVVPSLPGFAFSDHAEGAATAQAAAAAVHDLMADLGHERYAVHGGDWGGAVAHALMTEHPEAVVAAHLTDIPFYLHFAIDREDLEPHERDVLDAADARQEEPQYYRIQAERPLTLSYGMADSPVALLAWLTNLYTAWTDRELDEHTVLANASLYWLTNTFHSSVRFYSEGTGSWDEDDADWSGGEETAVQGSEGDDAEADWSAGATTVPTAFAIHPADIVVPTRSYAERFFAVERFTLMSGGGHFSAMDCPDALATDLAEFLAGRS